MSDVIHEITAGFFDSVNQDRMYSADQMNMPYKKIVSDGLFFEGGDGGNVFKVSAAGGMKVIVGPGNALIGGKWAENEEDVEVEISANTSEAARIDSVILRLDNNLDARAIGIVYRQGGTSAPSLDTSANVKEFRLANINISVNAVAITDVDIVDNRGESDCPWVLSIVSPSEAQLIAGVGAYIRDNPTALIPAVEDSVTEWLEEHPEKTTTVQNGSITAEKLNTSLIDSLVMTVDGGSIEIVHDHEGLLASTADRVIVINDDSYYGSGNTVAFVKSPNSLNGLLELHRDNGDYMMPEPGHVADPSNVPVKSIGDTIASYVNKDTLTYGGDYGAFNEVCNGEIDCSTFVYLVMQGVDYEHSRYSGISENIKGHYVGDNIPRNEESAFTTRSALNSSEMALFFAGQNRLFYIDYDKGHPASQLQAGDLIFFTNYENERTKDRYFAVYHVAIVIQTYPDSDVVLMAQAGGSKEYLKEPVGANSVSNVCHLALMRIDSTTEDTCIVYARPRYGLEVSTPEQIVRYAAFDTNVSTPTPGNRSRLANLFFKKPLNKDRMYTLSVGGEIPFDAAEGVIMDLYIQTPDYNIHACRLLHIMTTNKAVMPFVPIENISAATAVWLVVWTPTGTDSYTVRSYSVSKIGIYDGLFPDISPKFESAGECVTFNSIVTVSGKYVWVDGDKLHIRASLKLAAAPLSEGYTDIGYISTNAIPKQNFSYERFCKVGTEIRAFEISTADAGAVRVYLKTTDAANDNIIIDLEL